jgi:hypothetical protein
MSIRRMMLFSLGAKIKNIIEAFKSRVFDQQGEFEADTCLNTTLRSLNTKELLDNASLVITPNGYKETLLYAVEPNEVGTNLVLRSQDFTQSVWNKGGATIVSSTRTAPDGTATATELSDVGASSTPGVPIQANIIATSTSIVFSIYTKNVSVTNPRTFLLRNGTTLTNFVGLIFDYSSTGNLGNGWFSENVGNGWFRLSYIRTSGINIGDNLIIYYGRTNSGLVGANDVWQVWGAQVVPGSTVTDYIPTTDRAIIDGTIGDLIVTRSTTGTRVNSEGLIEEVPYNLFQRSEEFDNIGVWPRQNILSISTNVANSPIGTLTADKIIPDTTLNQHRIYQPFNFSGQGVLSVYAKADGYNFLSLAIGGGVSGQSIYFNLSNGTISGTASGFTPSIESVGNGWYRCSIYRADLGAGVNLSYWIIARESETTNNYTGNGTSGIFVWGAQLVRGSEPKPYLKTITRLNIPRIDYSNGSCPSILVEPQRTNLLLYSEQFDNSYWTKYQSSIVANSILSPNNTITADTLIENSTSNLHIIYKSFTTSSATTYNLSFFVKPNGRDIVWLRSDTSIGTRRTQFNLTGGGTIGIIGSNHSNPVITPLINGWYRCSVAITETTATAGLFACELATLTGIMYLGDGVSGVHIWGAQLE